MGSRGLAVALTTAAGLAAPAAVPAAVTLGATGPSPVNCTSGTFSAVQDADTSGVPTYRIPANGVITRMRTNNPGPGPYRLRIARPLGGESFRFVGSVVGTNGSGVQSMDTRIVVAAGDRLGYGGSGGGNVHCVQTVGSGTVRSNMLDPADGADSSLSTIPGTARLNVDATFELDEDGDGYGDDSQDLCPADPTRFAQRCPADLALALTVAEPKIPSGGVGVVVFTARNISAGPSDGVKLTATLAGLDVVVLAPSSGTCSGLACELGTIAGGAAAAVTAVVRGGAGAKSLAGTLSATTSDPQTGNNVAAGTLEVLPAAPPPAPLTPATTLTPSTPALALCRVPRVIGLTQAAATRALTRARCRLGALRRTGGSRRRRVRAQTIPAGTQVLAGTRVGITLRGQRARRRPR